MKVTRILATVCLVAVLASVASAELVGHYRFDSPSNLGIDSTSNGYDVATYGNVPDYTPEGRIGGAASFDGTQGLSRSTYLFDSKAFTLSLWVKPDITSPLVVRSMAGSRGPGITMASTEFRFWTYYGSGQSTWVGGLTAPSLGQWQHIAMTFEPQIDHDTYDEGVLRVYHNGVLTNTKTDALITVGDWTGIGIGRYGSNYFTGDIDDVRVYNRVLSDSEILAYVESMPPVPIQAIAYYSFDDPNNLPDGMGTDYSGSEFNLVPYDVAPDFVDAGKIAGAASFNGSTQGYKAETGVFTTNSFTFAMWVKPTAISTLVARTMAARRGPAITMTSVQYTYWTFYDDGTAQSTYIGGGVAPKLNEWQHIAMTFESTSNQGLYDEGIIRTYYNGILTSVREDAKYSYGTWSGLGVGRYGSNYFKGELDDVAVFGTVLSDEQIFNLASGKSNPMYVNFIGGMTDLNNDGITNFHDFTELAQGWLKGSY